MKTDEKKQRKKVQYDINIEAAKIVLSLSEIDSFEYLTNEEILPTDQNTLIEQAKFTCCPLRKASKKKSRETKEQGKNKLIQ